MVATVPPKMVSGMIRPLQVLTAAALSDSVGGVDPELLILDDISSK